jgi:hypothetical protein
MPADDSPKAALQPTSQPEDRPWHPPDLHRVELWWVKHQPWLLEQGYELRPRFRSNWKPSWEGTRKDWEDCEDGQLLSVRHMMCNTQLYTHANASVQR